MERIRKFRSNKEVHLSKEDGKIVVKRKDKTLTFQATDGVIVVKIHKDDILVNGMLPAFNDCFDVNETNSKHIEVELPDDKKDKKGEINGIPTTGI